MRRPSSSRIRNSRRNAAIRRAAASFLSRICAGGSKSPWRRGAKFLIIARTDARSALGLDEALRRGEAYVKAGADVLFIESPESEEELSRIARSFDVPLLANMVEGGRTPVLPARRLEELGFRIAIHPVAGLLAAAAALRRVYRGLREPGSPADEGPDIFPFAEFNRLMGFEEIWEFERRHAEHPKGGAP